ncbi:SDR family oxidoreductase [Roseibium sp.]|uniref:SDR family oxidoreductase n=1 Tax=Roseibium sp. TaxID=1936156 RepID=UPI0039F011C3
MKKAVVLGAYGFIGAACVRALQAQGHSVCGVGRSKDNALRTFPDLVWVFRDISATSIDDWRDILGDADVVVNASGALQDGTRDNLKAIHQTAVERIIEALAGSDCRFIQISATGVSHDAPTPFFRTKAAGDKIVSESKIDWIILRPALVLGPEAYGGSALLRAAAAVPFVEVTVFADAEVQTIHIDDLADAVVLCAGGQLGSGFSADLSEEGHQSFPALTRKVRAWLGYPDWSRTVRAPDALIRLLGKGADLLSWLGWRSPLRTNALVSLESGITADGREWTQRGGPAFRSLEETLREFPATSQERSFARLYLLMPMAIGCLALFWLLSGLIGFLSFEDATRVLTDRGTSPAVAAVFVASGAVVDIALGLAVLWRRWTRLACLGMIVVSGCYLLGGTVLAPQLWADPLGPLVKVFPALVLAAMVALLLEER